MEDSGPFSWLDLIDESMCHLPPTAYTDLVAEAHLLLQDILEQQMSFSYQVGVGCGR